ncbi:MAG: hypothetical protein OES26_08140 [Gammaproteobacteria bacterium]|nr:hypothetical protein [Gammaproteobacteria bacterium]
MICPNIERIPTFPVAMLLSLFLLTPVSDAQTAIGDDGVTVIGPVEPVVINKTLLDVPALPVGQSRIAPSERIPPRQITNPDALLRPRPPTIPKLDPLLELQSGATREQRNFTTPNLNLPGHFGVCCPPDTVGEIGPTHFVLMTNGIGAAGTSYSIFDKTGSLVAGFPKALEALAPAMSGCENADGDPIPLYDQLANRWVLTQFEIDGGAGVHGLCLYISSGHNPVTSTWQVYKFPTPGTSFPDYPKYAVWPNAYYIGTNESARPGAPAGSHPVYAVDRAKMLAGQPATMIVLDIPTSLAGFGFEITPPVDVAGQMPPPAGAPGMFIRHRDDEAHDGASNATDTLEIFEFQPDFTTPGNSTLTGPTSISIADFDSDLCGLNAFDCFPQPGTAQLLDPVQQPVMQRPVYRNFGTHQSLIGSLTTDVSGTDRGGIRWFELRRNAGVTTGGWSKFQEGTYSPDAVNRWMSSLAMDKQGNMALGYSVSDATTTFPGIRYTGRTVDAAAGTMNQGETTIADGGVAQEGLFVGNRWGDYSGMTVDPVDDCTFWFTTEYMPAGAGALDPRTRFATFDFDACQNSCTDPDSENLALSAETVTTTQAYEVCNTITVGPAYDIAGGDVTMQAGRAVVFLPGFRVSAGGKLTVRIQ